MSDLGPEDGGETVFPKAWPPGIPESERLDEKQAIEQLRASPNGKVLERGSWEEQLVCLIFSRERTWLVRCILTLHCSFLKFSIAGCVM